VNAKNDSGWTALAIAQSQVLQEDGYTAIAGTSRT
jgi:hypothetical protein